MPERSLSLPSRWSSATCNYSNANRRWDTTGLHKSRNKLPVLNSCVTFRMRTCSYVANVNLMLLTFI